MFQKLTKTPANTNVVEIRTSLGERCRHYSQANWGFSLDNTKTKAVSFFSSVLGVVPETLALTCILSAGIAGVGDAWVSLFQG